MPIMRVTRSSRAKGPKISVRVSDEFLYGGSNGQNDHQKRYADESASSAEDEDGEEWESSCICGIKEDNYEDMVQCDVCFLRWEHIGCIFPRSKKVPSGKYLCHVCHPRDTELTAEQARAYQDGVQKKKDDAKKRKSAGGSKKKQSAPRRTSSRARSTGGAQSEQKNKKKWDDESEESDADDAQAPEDRPLRRSSRHASSQASEQPVEKEAATRKEQLSKKRELTISLSGESADEQPAEKTVKVEEDESIPDPPPPSGTPSAFASPPTTLFAEADNRHEELAKPNDLFEPIPGSPPPSSSHSSEVDELHKKMAKLQDKYQRACDAAREADIRAERAERLLLDVKPASSDSCEYNKKLEKRVADLTAKLEEARGEIDDVQAKKQDLARKNDVLSADVFKLTRELDVAKRVAENCATKTRELKEEMEVEKIGAPTRNELDRAHGENVALKAELDLVAAQMETTRAEAAKESAALKRSLDTSRRLELLSNDRNDFLTRENAKLKEMLSEKRNEEENAKKED